MFLHRQHTHARVQVMHVSCADGAQTALRRQEGQGSIRVYHNIYAQPARPNHALARAEDTRRQVRGR
eukprot:COSAG02_NODE_19295_length_890_cov_0.911504_2_plen_66_part_01